MSLSPRGMGGWQVAPRLFLSLFLLTVLLFPITPPPETGGVEEGRPDFGKYWSYMQMTEQLKEWSIQYSDIFLLTSIGKTYEGRELWAVKISDNPGLEDDGGSEEEPDVLVMGAHHGNEWISYMVPLYIINFLLTNYGEVGRNGSIATSLVDHLEIWFVPIVNPDGTEYSRQTDRGWRKNREPNYLSDRGPDGNFNPDLVPYSYGTDLNRNYAWHWGEMGGSDPHLSRSSTYPGPPDNKDDDGDARIPIDLWDRKTPLGPEDGVDEDPVDGIDNDGDGLVDEDPNGGFSTAETRAIKKLVEANSFTISLSYHSYSELVIYPWGYTPQPTEDDSTFRQLASYIAEPMGYRPIQGYDLYQTDGDSDDWLYGVHHVFAFTVELAESFVPPEDKIAQIADENLWGFFRACSYAHNPYQIHLNITMNSTITNDGIAVNLFVKNNGYPYPFPENPFVLKWRDERSSGEVMMRKEGEGGVEGDHYRGVIPRTGGKIQFWVAGRDVDGRPIRYPTIVGGEGGVEVLNPSSTGLWPEVHFTFSTVAVMLVILGVIWGGFIVALRKAMRSEREKREV